jgi:molybdate transport system permease protein
MPLNGYVAAVSASDWSAIRLSIQVSVVATLLALVPGVLIAVWLARTRSVFRSAVEVAVTLPLVVPPVATGFALLQLMLWLNLPLPFTRWAACVAGAVVSAPLLIRTVRAAVEQIDPRLGLVAATLGASKGRVLLTITLPLSWRGIVGGATLAWARAVGEFGATVIVAGDVAGETRTIPLAIWSSYQTGGPVGRLIVASVVLSICAIALSEYLVRRGRGMSRRARAGHPKVV